MNAHFPKFHLTACALAASVLLAACGGGTAEPPPETVAPTVTITDSEAGATATGPVTFTFTFSEDVGTSFTAEDVLVTGGTAGTLVKVSATVYTMEVTPTPGVSGTMTVSIAANKFTDLALNANTASASGSQAYGDGGGGSTALISWDEAEGSSPVSGIGAYGDASPTVEAAPSGGTGSALKISRTGGMNFGGTYFTVTPALPFTSTDKSITARVYASRAGAVINLKVEVPGGSSVEVPATVTAANTWQTLTWDLSAVNTANSYTVIAISPDTDVAIGGAQTYWIDDINVVATAGGGGGGGGGGAASGNTGTCTTPCIDFSSAGVGYEGFEGLISVAQAADPADASNKVAKFVKGPTGQPWAGATIYTAAGDKSVTAFDFAASKVVTLRVYSPAAGLKMTLKVENAADPGTNALKTVSTTKANEWETLTFDFTTPTQGSAASGTFNKVSFFPLFDPTANPATAPASDTTVYIDELKYTAAAGGGGGGGGTVATFSAGFSANNLTANGGGFGGFSGSNLDGYNCNGDPANCGGGGTFSGDAASGFYYYYQTTTPATDLYMGIYAFAPGVTGFNNAGDTAGLSVGSTTNLKFTLGQNAEWFGSATNNFMIVVDLGKRYDVGGNTCRLQLRNVTTPVAAAATAYSIPWSSFDLVQNCGQTLTVAQALAASPVSQISFQGVGGGIALSAGGKTSGANLSVSNGTVYPTTLVVNGAITFE